MSKSFVPPLVAALAVATSAALTGVVVSSQPLTASKDLQLLPDGTFNARDGRPHDAPGWHMDAALAQKLIAAADARKTDYVIDYEHQTIQAASNGQPAPAAAFFKKLEWRPGVGLFATDVEWTARAKAMIEAKEYRYFSPVITYDKTGAVTGILMGAITNNPAIDGMADVLQAAASAHFAATTAQTTNQEQQMDPTLRALLCALLNLSKDATDAQMVANAQLVMLAANPAHTGAAAAAVDLASLIGQQRTQIASLSAATPDPAKYVPIAAMQALQTQHAALAAETTKGKVDGLVKTALEQGKLVPAQEAWARELGTKDVAALTSFLESAPQIAALKGPQSGGKDPTGGGTAALTAEQAAMCTALGVSQDEFIKTLRAEGST